ncbi:MAG: Holliday junction branch migration protein RuvA [Ancalomicrobiaceae bacterium]|nr:Holliday junction branch migration protein RuvA [Ancalomicrobiaceae bacterium]
MIGKLSGLVDSYGDDFVILDVGGVGYIVSCSARTLQNLPSPGEAASLAIETYVREDQIRLFGFAGPEEKEWFRLLMLVQGVGAKVALNILSVLTPGELASAIAFKDVTAISRANGVGKRLAERVVQELKDKAPAFASVDPAVVTLVGQVAERNAPKPVADAVSALTNLGYPQIRASAAVATAHREAGEDATTERLIRLALKELAQ